MKIKTGDTIKIIKGKDRGKSGKVIKVDPAKLKILIEGLNLFKKHIRPKKQGEKGEIVAVPRPLHIANAMIVCPTCKNATRTAYKLKDKIKSRYCKKCQAKI